MAEKLLVKGNNKRNRNTAILALLLTLTIAIPLAALPNVSAQDGKTTYPYIGAVPNPVGVNQEVLLHLGITDTLNNAALGFEGLTVEITDPNGDVETTPGIKTDSTGGTGWTIFPDIVGNWTLQTHFPAQTIGGSSFAESWSEELTLVVQEEPIPYYPTLPLPTEYWTRPIDGQLREWDVIAGSWLASPPNLYAPYNENAPETAHILWTKPLENGGLAGGIPNGAHAFEAGDAYC